MSVIIDTSVYVAYDNEKDEKHSQAIEIMKQVSKGEFGHVILSDYVFDEFLNYGLGRRGKTQGVVLGENLLSSGALIHYTTPGDFKEAWTLFKKSTALSFTDCIIAIVARGKNAQIATFDGHFSQLKDLRIIS